MPKEQYRYYRLDSTGSIHEAAWVAAAHDDDAIAQIESKHPQEMCEIWLGKRKVASLSPAQIRA